MTSLVVYGGALIFGVYFAVSAAYLWVYRYFFRNYTQATKGEGDRWGKHFWNHDYERTQNENWRLILTVVILGILVALCFVIVAWAAYNFMRNTLQTKKITLFIALTALSIFAFLIAVYYLNDRRRYDFVRKYFKKIGDKKILGYFFWIAIISLVLAFLNAVFNVLGALQGYKNGRGYSLFFGFLWLILGIITLIFAALLLKDVQTISDRRPMTCSKAADIAHEKEYVRGWSKFCHGKYLNNG